MKFSLLVLLLVVIVACSVAGVEARHHRKQHPKQDDIAVDAERKWHSLMDPEAKLTVGKLPAHLHSLLSKPVLFDHLKSRNEEIRQRAEASLNCTICEAGVSLVLPYLNTSTFRDDIGAIAVDICLALKPECGNPTACQQLCSDIIPEYLPIVFDLVLTYVLTPLEVCVALKQCDAPPPAPIPTNIPVRSNLKNLNGEIQWPSWSQDNGIGTFAHLSDVHLDPVYSPGASNDCGLPTCCHITDGPGINASTIAGYWGDYACDTAPWLAQDLVNYLDTLDPVPDFILYTGDDPAHDVWKQSREENMAAIQMWSKMLNDTLGTHIPIFHTLGNHASFPVNQFQGPGLDSWLYDGAMDAWAPFLPEDAQRTFSYGGYYQARVRPGLRVISLNSNYFTTDNFFFIFNKTDSYHQLNWLDDVLMQAEQLGEKAIIICHAPIASWESNMAMLYLSIATKYQQTIVNLFMGHTHDFSYQSLHVPQENGMPGTPMHVAWVSGSVVPFTDINPGFSMYYYDRSAVAAGKGYQYLAQDVRLHWVNLVQANSANSTNGQWEPTRWNVREGLGVATLDATSLSNLAPKFITNSTLYNAFVLAMYKGVEQQGPSPAELACDVSMDTDAQRHACKHSVAGLNENQIRAAEEKAATKC